MRVDPTETAVVVVDMQNEFCHPEGALYAPDSEAAITPITELVERARESGASVAFTRDVHPPEQFEDAHYYDEFDRWGEHVLEDSWGAELIEDLDPRESELVVVKHTYDAFHETQLDGWLSAHGIKDLIICGTLANVCVLHTASSAGLRDYRPILARDAIGCIEQSHREYALDHADWLFGEVADWDEIAFKNS
jgi:nicotinamidase-related amidase